MRIARILIKKRDEKKKQKEKQQMHMLELHCAVYIQWTHIQDTRATDLIKLSAVSLSYSHTVIPHRYTHRRKHIYIFNKCMKTFFFV